MLTKRIITGQIKESIIVTNADLNNLQKHLTKRKLHMLAAFIYAINNNANWIYTNNGFYHIEKEWLIYATNSIPNTGIVYDNDARKDIFDSCDHFTKASKQRSLESQVIFFVAAIFHIGFVRLSRPQMPVTCMCSTLFRRASTTRTPFSDAV